MPPFDRRVAYRFLFAITLLAGPAAGAQTNTAAPAGLFESHQDVGVVLHAGSVAFDASRQSYTIAGSGENMWGNQDAFHFAWKKAAGDLALSADVSFLGAGTDPHRKAVLMVRQSLDADSAYVDVALHGDGLTSLQFRGTKGAATAEVKADVKGPRRLRLEKRGKTARMFVAGEGEAFRFSGAETSIEFKEPFYVGIGVCAHDQDVVEKAVFSAVELLTGLRAAAPPTRRPGAALDWIRTSDDETHFVNARTGERVVMWGFNYDRDDGDRLIEDYWAEEWGTVAEDFAEMKALGANVVRVHLQIGQIMTAPDRPDAANLNRLGDLVRLAERLGLYLDVTGLGCYHKHDVPAWYDALGEADRWAVQARFWIEVARVCRDSPAVFCYDLMNEPLLAGGQQPGQWLPGEPLGGKHFVQRITIDPRGRTDKQIAKAWVETLTRAIRSVDDRHMITVGVIPWAQVFKGAKPLFYSPEVGGPLDFVSVHFYPRAVAVDESLAVLKVYDVGKPLVVEEIFPLHTGVERTAQFIDRSRDLVDGYVSFYWGKQIEENRRKGDIAGALTAEWLERFSAMSPYVQQGGAAAPR